MPQYEHGRQRERVILRQSPCPVRTQRQPVDVGIDCHTEIGATIANQLLQLAEILRNRFGRSRKPAVRLHVDRRHLASEPFEQCGHYHSTRAMDAVEGDVESVAP